MPDFNKGDFTQQGVAGHVNAILRLNEKRSVGIDLTSDEEAEGCTITGAVYDLLNEEVYPIGAGVSGNIEITENGENINVAPYATATVNVSGGGGDALPICIITAVNDGLSEQPVVDYISPVDMTVHRGIILQPSETLQIAGFYRDMGSDTYTVVIPQGSAEQTFGFIVSPDNTKFSSPVNIVITELGGVYGPIVTDTSEPSSITVSASLLEPK